MKWFIILLSSSIAFKISQKKACIAIETTNYPDRKKKQLAIQQTHSDKVETNLKKKNPIYQLKNRKFIKVGWEDRNKLLMSFRMYLERNLGRFQTVCIVVLTFLAASHCRDREWENRSRCGRACQAIETVD